MPIAPIASRGALIDDLEFADTSPLAFRPFS